VYRLFEGSFLVLTWMQFRHVLRNPLCYGCRMLWLSGAGGGASNSAEQPRTVFHRALEAFALTWDDAHLEAILHGDVSSSYVCHGCHGARSMYRHGDGAVSYVCVQHDIAGRLIWTGMFTK